MTTDMKNLQYGVLVNRMNRMLASLYVDQYINMMYTERKKTRIFILVAIFVKFREIMFEMLNYSYDYIHTM